MWHRTDSEIFQEAVRQSPAEAIVVTSEDDGWAIDKDELLHELASPGAHPMAACKPRNYNKLNWVVYFMGHGHEAKQIVSCQFESLGEAELRRIIEARAIAEACETPAIKDSQFLRI